MLPPLELARLRQVECREYNVPDRTPLWLQMLGEADWEAEIYLIQEEENARKKCEAI